MKRLLTLAPVIGLLLLGSPSTPMAVGQTPSQGGIASENVEYVGFVPFEQSSSTGMTLDMKRKILYLTSWKNISSYDFSDPENPVQLGTLPVGFMFENEEVALDPQGKFILFSESLPNDVLHVYDVEDPTSIVEVATLDGAGDHTTTCILKCDYAYGSDGSISNLTDYKNPKTIALDTDKDNWHNRIGLIGGAHHVREIRDGLILSSNLDETPWIIDVKNPEKPKVLAQGDGPKGWAGERGYLWHSGRWPREGKDRWVLMGGEDVLNPPKRTTCQEDQGPFATFDSTGWQKTHKITVVDFFRVDDGVYADGNPPVSAFGCSGHWFQEHSTFNNGGLVVMAWYDHGTRFMQVKSNGKIEQVGYFLPYAGESSSTYWASDEIVYVADYSRGLDILRWTGPTYAPAAPGGGGGGGGGGDGGGGGGGTQLPGPGVRLRISDRNPDQGDQVGFRVALRRCKGNKGTTVKLQRKVKGDYKPLATKALGSNCVAKFTDVASYKRASYRATWPKQNDDYRAGKSRPQTVTPQP